MWNFKGAVKQPEGEILVLDFDFDSDANDQRTLQASAQAQPHPVPPPTTTATAAETKAASSSQTLQHLPVANANVNAFKPDFQTCLASQHTAAPSNVKRESDDGGSYDDESGDESDNDSIESGEIISDSEVSKKDSAAKSSPTELPKSKRSQCELSLDKDYTSASTSESYDSDDDSENYTSDDAFESDSSLDSSSSDEETEESDDTDSDLESKDSLSSGSTTDEELYDDDDEEDEDDDDDEDEPVKKGDRFQELRTQNEIPEPPSTQGLNIPIEPWMKLEYAGKVYAITGTAVVIEAAKEGTLRALDSGTILLTQDRVPLGRIAETFGPVLRPMYTVRYATVQEITAQGVTVGMPVFHLPDHAVWVLTESIRNMKGSDASNMFDEEVSEDELDFSDDEKEMQHNQRKMKPKKRPHNVFCEQSSFQRHRNINRFAPTMKRSFNKTAPSVDHTNVQQVAPVSAHQRKLDESLPPAVIHSPGAFYSTLLPGDILPPPDLPPSRRSGLRKTMSNPNVRLLAPGIVCISPVKRNNNNDIRQSQEKNE